MISIIRKGVYIYKLILGPVLQTWVSQSSPIRLKCGVNSHSGDWFVNLERINVCSYSEKYRPQFKECWSSWSSLKWLRGWGVLRTRAAYTEAVNEYVLFYISASLQLILFYLVLNRMNSHYQWMWSDDHWRWHVIGSSSVIFTSACHIILTLKRVWFIFTFSCPGPANANLSCS